MSESGQSKIAREMAEGGADKYVPPLQLSHECARALKVVRPSSAQQHQLLETDARQYRSHVNVANLRVLRRHIQRNYKCLRHLQQRSAESARLAELMARRPGSVAQTASRYGKQMRFENSMRPAAYGYHRACLKYDAAREAVLRRENSTEVNRLIAEGLVESDKSMGVVKAALESENEALPSDKTTKSSNKAQ